MSRLALSLFFDSDLCVDQELPRAGTTLENPFVYDAVAKEFKELAKRGLVQIVEESTHEADEGTLIDSLRYRRLRVG